MEIVRPFCYDRRNEYFAACEPEPVALYAEELDWFERLPFTEPKRNGEHNYDTPWVRSHGKRGRR